MPRWQRSLLAGVLAISSGYAQAWWNGPNMPYYAQPNGYSWPNAWPSFGPGYGYSPYGYNGGYGGSDWSVKGYMTEQGDAHFVIEYHGNIYDDMFGRNYGNGGFPGSWGRYPGGYGMPYYGGWR